MQDLNNSHHPDHFSFVQNHQPIRLDTRYKKDFLKFRCCVLIFGLMVLIAGIVCSTLDAHDETYYFRNLSMSGAGPILVSVGTFMILSSLILQFIENNGILKKPSVTIATVPHRFERNQQPIFVIPDTATTPPIIINDRPPAYEEVTKPAILPITNHSVNPALPFQRLHSESVSLQESGI